MLRILLDGTEVVNYPKGASDLTERLYYSEQIGAYLTEINGTLIFRSDERDYIYNQWVSNTCSTITIEIQKPDNQGINRIVFNGLIFLSDCVFYDDEGEVECEIVDNNILARIENNKKTEMTLHVPISKNGVDISGAYSIYGDLDIFTYSPGGGTYSNRYAIEILEAFKALMAFMTDDGVDFVSDFFSNNTTTWTEGNQYVLVSGLELRVNGSQVLPKISFDNLYSDLKRCYNLRMAVENYTDARPTIRIEPKSYFKNTDYIQLDDVRGIQYMRKPNNSYDKLIVGNALSDETNQLPLFDYIWNGWKTKEYIFQGDCNDGSNDLDLTFQTLCVDVEVADQQASNLITNDDTPFYMAVAFFGGGAYEFWNPYELYIAGVNYNNKSTRNGEIIDRWQDDIFSPLANFDYDVNDMRSTRTTQQTMVAFTEVIFDNDSTDGNYDNGNTYDNTTGFYTCLLNGTYRMRFNITLASATNSSTFTLGFAFTFGGGPNVIGYYYPGQVLPQSYTLNAGESQTFELEYEAPFLEGAGEPFEATISVMVNKTAGTGTLTVEPDSYFEVFTPASGTFRDFSTNTATSKEVNARGAISSSQWDSMKENRGDIVILTSRVNNQEGYIQDIERNIESGESTIKLLGRFY